MSFSTHILSLNAAALHHLGLLERGEGEERRDLEASRHIIDTLSMLEEKTQGNLNAEESRLLRVFLKDLKLRYVKLH